MSEGPPKLVAIDEEADHQIVHGRRFRKTNRAAHETLDPCPQIDVLALDLIIPNWQMSPTILKLLKMCHENASS